MSDEEVHTAKRDLVAIMAEIIMSEDISLIVAEMARAAELIEQLRLRAGGREC